MKWLHELFAQSAPDDWMSGRWVQGGALTAAIALLAFLFKRFINREDRVEDGWKTLLQNAQSDAANARADAVAARVEVHEARAETAELRKLVVNLEMRAGIAASKAASAKFEADQCHEAREAMQAELTELRRLVDGMRGH